MRHLKILILVILFSQLAYAQEKSAAVSGCKQCHETNIPTKDNPRLKKCPRDLMETVHRSPSQGPNVIMMDNFKTGPNLYPPVRFSHKTHAEMADMSGSCQMCHHYNPVGPILSCKECHSAERKRSDVSKIDLKGAYHVRCMNCHRSFTNQVECNTCHKQNEKKSAAAAKKTTHMEVKRPVVLTYETKYNKGKLVTFYHDEHVSTFGLDCVQCHTDDGCVKCHRKSTVPANMKPAMEQKHSKCSKCHSVKDNCSMCHTDQKKGPFDHKVRTGWELNKFHVKLSCSKCHTGKGQFTKLNSECSSCHSKWTAETFDHKITGLQLDETHAPNECDVCHTEKNFKKPVCSNCHENYNYPDKKPGKLIKK